MNNPHTSETQRCGRCKQEVPIEQFSAGNQGKSGSWCRPCFAAYMKGYRDKVEHQPMPCEWCGKAFVPKQLKLSGPQRTRFCSPNCKQRARYERVNARQRRTCEVCGADITNRRRDVRWCTERCARVARQRDGRQAAAVRKSKLKTTYGLTLDQYDALVASQNGRCAICGSGDPKSTRNIRWVIDHDHNCCPSQTKTCGKCIRGLLCTQCNLGLGQFEDSPDLLTAAAAYLRRPRLML